MPVLLREYRLPGKTFAEQLDGLTVKRSQHTDQLTAMLTRITLALAGRAADRLAAQLGLPGSRDKARQVTGWIIRPASDRTETEQANLARILARCPVLRAVDQLVGDFGGMLRQRRGQRLCMASRTVQASGISQLQGFAAGLLEDYDAVRGGLTLTWSNCAAEGTITIIEVREESHV